jgi:hypothetical protein
LRRLENNTRLRFSSKLVVASAAESVTAWGVESVHVLADASESEVGLNNNALVVVVVV